MVAGLLDSQQRGLLNRQAGGLLAGSPSFASMYPGVGMNTPPLRSMTPEMAAALVQQGMPSLAPSQFVQGMAGGAAGLAMQANQAMPWGGNDPSAIGIDTARGTIDPSVMVPFASNVAGMAGTGGMASPKPAGTLGMFGGRLAKTADQAALAKAEQMAAQGAPRDAIWAETGWFQGVDGKWRFEIPDNAATAAHETVAQLPREATPAGEMFKHPDMFAAYPDLAQVPTSIMRAKDVGGSIVDGGINPALKGAMWATADDGPRMGVGEFNYSVDRAKHPPGSAPLPSAVSHEFQHGIQDIEDFARGGSPEAMAGAVDEARAAAQATLEDVGGAKFVAQFYAKGDDLPAVLAKARARYAGGQMADYVDDAITKGWAAWERLGRPTGRNLANVEKQASLAIKKTQAMTTRDAYRRLAGETEARNVQTRQNMTAEQRRATPPWATQDTPDAEQIVRMAPPGSSYSTGGRF